MRRHVDRSMRDNARHLRADSTMVERKLWLRLRALKAQGYHFRRQVPFRTYILDFAEHRCRLAIELDGSQHGYEENRRRDADRDATLASEGYRVLRFWNCDVVENIDGVVEAILRAAASAPHPELPGNSDLPTRGR